MLIREQRVCIYLLLRRVGGGEGYRRLVQHLHDYHPTNRSKAQKHVLFHTWNISYQCWTQKDMGNGRLPLQSNPAHVRTKRSKRDNYLCWRLGKQVCAFLPITSAGKQRMYEKPPLKWGLLFAPITHLTCYVSYGSTQNFSSNIWVPFLVRLGQWQFPKIPLGSSFSVYLLSNGNLSPPTLSFSP